MILVAGAGGFIGRSVVRALGPSARPVGHAVFASPTRFADMTAVVHAGRDPRLGTGEYRLDDDAELAVARLAAARGLAFLSLGTRKVYAASDRPLDEAARLGPADRYGEQKLALEEALAALLGPLLTRLRLANIFGFEPGRRGFMGLMQDGLLRDGTVTFDMSPFTPRDFLDVATTGAAIAALAQAPPGGVVNVGSGVALETGRLALALIEGFGRGRLVVTDPAERDGFVLDCTRLHALTGIATDAAALLGQARALGRELRAQP